MEAPKRKHSALDNLLPPIRGERQEKKSSRCPIPDLDGKEIVLVAEDDPQFRNFIQAVLEPRGYEVLVAGDGLEALKVARNHRSTIHLLVSDLEMPKLDGSELLAAMRSDRPDMAVLLISGSTRSSAVQRGLLNPKVNFLEKPFSDLDLLSAVRQSLGRFSPY